MKTMQHPGGKETRKYQADVLIIGGGIAGIVSALELLDSGKKIVLLDRDDPSKFGGLAKESFGGILMVGTPQQKLTGIKDNPEKAFQDWCRIADFGPEDNYPKLWAQYYAQNCLRDIYHWLSKRGVRFFPVVHWVERGHHRKGNSVPRFHMVWGTGKELIDSLVKVLNRHKNRRNLSVHFHHQVESLEFDNGVVVGCRGLVKNEGTHFEAVAEKTVVAAGGICGNLDLVKKHWHTTLGTPPAYLLNGSHQYADGKLHFEVEKIGGNLTHLDKQWNYAAGVHHPKPTKPLHGLSIVPPKSALWMNYEGRRIGPSPLVSGFCTRFLIEEICKQPKKYSWQVMNWKIAVKELAVSGAEYNDAIRDKNLFGFLKNILLGNRKLVKDLTKNCIDFVVANSVEELAKKMNELTKDNSVNPGLLKAEIEKYDRMIDAQQHAADEQLKKIAHLREYRGDRVRTCKFQKILDSKAGPLIAIREFILTRKSLGGIQTDLQSRVLSQGGDPIPGLYAAGEAAGFGGGGIHGLRALEGTFLGSCILTAQAAARSILGIQKVQRKEDSLRESEVA